MAHEVKEDKRETRANTRLRIANAFVGLYAAHAGRGPTRARALFEGDTVVCVLEDVLTTLEQNLVTSGHEDRVRDLRTALRDGIRLEVEREMMQITGRGVRACLSQIDPIANVAVEVCLLERPGDGHEPAELRRQIDDIRTRHSELSSDALALERRHAQAIRRAKELLDQAGDGARDGGPGAARDE